MKKDPQNLRKLLLKEKCFCMIRKLSKGTAYNISAFVLLEPLMMPEVNESCK